jgi:DNA (cytosine-5)-methyltransferase 1
MNFRGYTINDVLKAEKQNNFTVISTFAGGGGSSIGYKLAGGHVLAVVEIDPNAQETYRTNFPHTKIIPDDIREVQGKTLLNQLGLEVGELDILDGSPPCSSFSMAGSREKDWGKKCSQKGKRNKHWMIYFLNTLD